MKKLCQVGQAGERTITLEPKTKLKPARVPSVSRERDCYLHLWILKTHTVMANKVVKIWRCPVGLASRSNICVSFGKSGRENKDLKENRRVDTLTSYSSNIRS